MSASSQEHLTGASDSHVVTPPPPLRTTRAISCSASRRLANMTPRSRQQVELRRERQPLGIANGIDV